MGDIALISLGCW